MDIFFWSFCILVCNGIVVLIFLYSIIEKFFFCYLILYSACLLNQQLCGFTDHLSTYCIDCFILNLAYCMIEASDFNVSNLWWSISGLEIFDYLC